MSEERDQSSVVEANRREHRRMRVETTLHFRRAGEREHLLGRVRDLSAGGVSFEAERALEPGQVLEVVIRSGGPNVPPLCAQVLVIRCDPAEEGYLIGGEMRQVR